VMSFIAVYSKSIGLNDVAMYFYVAYSASTVVSRFTVGKIFDTKGANYVMIPGYVAFISGMLIYSQAVSSAVFIIPGVLMGFAISTVFPTSQTMIMRDVHPHKFGSAVSTFQSITDIGTGFGPMIIGAIIASTGYRHTYLICAAIATFSFLMYWVTYGRKNRIRGTSSLPDIQD